MVPFFPVETNGAYFAKTDKFGYTYDSYSIAPDQEESLSGSSKQGMNTKVSSENEGSSSSISRTWVFVFFGFISIASVASVLTIGIKRARATVRSRRGYTYVPVNQELPRTYGTVG